MSAWLYMFITAMLAGMGIVLARMWMDSESHRFEFKQIGETSLGRNSINWLAAIALLAAVVICVLVR